MQPRRKKQLVTLALSTALLLLLCFKPYELWVAEGPPQYKPMATSSWWNKSWQYRQAINISNTAKNLMGYQVKIELSSSNVGEHFNWSGNGSDLRFTYYNSSSNTETKIPYWIESWDSSNQEAIVWVNVTYLENNTNTTIYMYYGNPSADSESNVTSTFIRVIDGAIPVVGSWHFDEGSGNTVYDTSGNDNDGTITGAIWTDGKYGKALSFDGGDYVRVEDSPSLNFGTGDFSIEFWIKTETTAEEFVIMKGTTGVGGRRFLMKIGREGVGKIDIGLDDDVSDARMGSNTAINDNTWHHVVAVCDRDDKRKLYIDGVLDNSMDETVTGSINATAPLAIGAKSDALSIANFHGVIDEVRLYNRTLTSEEIADLYNNYGYTTENYPGRVLVRKYAEPEPLVSNFGSEESAYSMNLSFGPPGTTKFIFAACGPDFENATATPINQTDEYGIDLVCRENDGMGGTAKIQIKLSGPLNPGWTWYASNESDFSPNITLSTEWQDIIHGLEEGECAYVWHFANCSYVHERPGAYQIYRIVGE